MQRPWIDELRRVVRPGGHILITVSGVVGARRLLGDELARYEDGQLVVQGGRFEGRNYCAVVHPDAYVRNVLAHELELVAAVPAAEPEFDHDQDAYLLRVPEGG